MSDIIHIGILGWNTNNRFLDSVVLSPGSRKCENIIVTVNKSNIFT